MAACLAWSVCIYMYSYSNFFFFASLCLWINLRSAFTAIMHYALTLKWRRKILGNMRRKSSLFCYSKYVEYFFAQCYIREKKTSIRKCSAYLNVNMYWALKCRTNISWSNFIEKIQSLCSFDFVESQYIPTVSIWRLVILSFGQQCSQV